MKKSVDILGLPIISITEGRELGTSKTLLIDAKNGLVAAITIEDEDWYRGVKLIPYESVIAIGEDAITITHSENILKLDEAGDYEGLLDENIRVIGTKAITKNGTIQGKVTELFVGENGKIEKCEITAPDGTSSEVTAEQISIFGKQVTVIDAEKKTEFITETPAPAPVEEVAEPVQEVAEPVQEQVTEDFSQTASNDFGAVSVSEEVQNTPPVEEPAQEENFSEPVAELAEVMTPEPVAEETPAVEEVPVPEEIPAIDGITTVADIPAVEEEPIVEEVPAVAEEVPAAEEKFLRLKKFL